MTPKTNAERQKTWRQKQAAERARKAAAGLSEVRGIFAPANEHAAIKAAAEKLARKRAKEKT